MDGTIGGIIHPAVIDPRLSPARIAVPGASEGDHADAITPLGHAGDEDVERLFRVDHAVFIVEEHAPRPVHRHHHIHRVGLQGPSVAYQAYGDVKGVVDGHGLRRETGLHPEIGVVSPFQADIP